MRSESPIIDYAHGDAPNRAIVWVRRLWPFLLVILCLLLAVAVVPKSWIAYAQVRYELYPLTNEQRCMLVDEITPYQLNELFQYRPVLAMDLLRARQYRDEDMALLAQNAEALAKRGDGALAAEQLRWWQARFSWDEWQSSLQHRAARGVMKTLFDSALNASDKFEVCRSFFRLEGLDFKDSQSMQLLNEPEVDVEKLFETEFNRTASRLK